MSRAILIMTVTLCLGMCMMRADGDYYWNPKQLVGSGNVSQMGGDGIWDGSVVSFWDVSTERNISGGHFGEADPGANADYHLYFNVSGNITKRRIAYFNGSATSGVHVNYHMHFPSGNSSIRAELSNAPAGINTGNASGYIHVGSGAVLDLEGSAASVLMLVPGKDVSTAGGIIFSGGGIINMGNNACLVPDNANSRTVVEGGTTLNFNAGSGIWGANGTRERPLQDHMGRLAVNNGTLNLNGGDIYLGYRGGTPSHDRAWGLGVGLLNGDSGAVVNIHSGNLLALGDVRPGNTTRNAGVIFGGYIDTASGGTLNLNGGNLIVSNIRANRNVPALLNLNGGRLVVSTETIAKSTPFENAELQARLDQFIAGFNGNSTNRVVLGHRGVHIDTSRIDVTRCNGVATITSAIYDDGGFGALTKTGPNCLRLSGANGYQGDTIVEQGGLWVEGSLNGTALVKPRAALSGNGSLKDIVLEEGAILFPGKGMRGGLLTWKSSAELRFDLSGTISGDTLLTLSGVQTFGDAPFRIVVDNAGVGVDNITLISVTDYSTLSAENIRIEGLPGWGWVLSSDGRSLKLTKGADACPVWRKEGEEGLFSSASSWSSGSVPGDGVSIVMGSPAILLFDEARNYDVASLEIDNGVLAETAAGVPERTTLRIGSGGVLNRGEGIHFGNLTVVTESPQRWELGSGVLSFGKIIPGDLLEIATAGGALVCFNSSMDETWMGQINIIGSNPVVFLGDGVHMDEEHVSRISINGRPVRRSGDLLLVDPDATTEGLPLLHYTFDEDVLVYPSHGFIKSPLHASGFGQGSGGADSGVSGREEDLAWDASANLHQGLGGDSMLAHMAGLSFFEHLSAFTLTFWYYADQSFNPERTTLVHKKDERGGFALSTLYDPDFGRAFNFTLGDASVPSNYFSIPHGIGKTGHWLFVAVTWDGEKVSFYYGDKIYPAVRVGGGDFLGGIGCSKTPLIIGNRPDAAAPFDGKIDNFRFYDEALDMDLVEEIRESEAGPHVSDGRPIRELAQVRRTLGLSSGGNWFYAPFVLRSDSGRLLAAYTLAAANRKSLSGETLISLSENHGETWEQLSSVPLIHGRLFEVNDKICMVGHHESKLYICVSSDGGRSWSRPSLLDGTHDWLPTTGNVWMDENHVYFSADRRVMRVAEGGFPLPDIAPILFRAMRSADMTDALSWTQASELSFKDIVPGVSAMDARQDFIGLPFREVPQNPPGTPYHERRAQTPMGWRQAQVFQINDGDHYWDDPRGKTIHLLARAQTGMGGYGTMMKVVEEGNAALVTRLETVPSGEAIFFVPLPGGQYPYFIVQDSETKLYWLLALQEGVGGNACNRMLYFSRNMVDWCFAALLKKSEGMAQEVGMCIDGDDLQVMESISNDEGNEIRSYRVVGFRNLFY